MASLKALRGAHQQREVHAEDHLGHEDGGGAKLRRAQTQAEAARPYAERMQRMLAALAASGGRVSPTAPPLLVGTGQDQVHLLVVVTADRGLAGAFNTNVGRAARNPPGGWRPRARRSRCSRSAARGATTCAASCASRMVGDISFAGKKRVEFADAQEIGRAITAMLTAGEFDVCTVVYNRFVSVISQIADRDAADPAAARRKARPAAGPGGRAARCTSSSRTRRPSSRALLPQNLAIQIYPRAAGEQRRRATARG